MTEPSDNTRTSGPQPDTAPETGVQGGDADRMDSPGEASGGLAGAGADGETGAREDLRKDLGERDGGQGTEEGGELEQAAALGETDDPQGGSIQSSGGLPPA